MTKLQGVPFENGKTCKGVSYVADAPLDMAEIVIDGRYPEEEWARNLEVHEIVRVLRGTGRLVLRASGVTYVEKGDVVHVPQGEWFAWSGDMTLLMACNPPFSPDQYETKEG